jgi:hypothetical protein
VPNDLLVRRLALAMHAGLAIAVGLVLASLELVTSMRLTAIVLALLPLLATLRGLVAGSSERLGWLALSLVLYAGLGAVEVIARTHPAAVVVLLLALIELALVLSLTRGRNSRSPRATRES